MRFTLYVFAVLMFCGTSWAGPLMTTITAPTPLSSVNHHLVTVVDRQNRLPNLMHIETLGLYSMVPRSVKMKIVQRTSAGAYTVVSDTPWPHPGGGWQWLNIPAYDVPATGDFYLAYYYPSTANNLIGCNSLVPRATFTPDIGLGSYTGGIESTSDVAAMAASSAAFDQPFSRVAAGIIRPDGTGGWFILNDGDHAPVNLSSVSVFSDHLEVFFSQPFGQLTTFSVDPDDDLTLVGIRTGASTGLTKIGIVFANSAGLVNPTTIVNTLANVQIFVAGRT